jgi:hypothetical protein
VTDLKFERDVLIYPALSLQHFRKFQEATIGQLAKVIAELHGKPAKLEQLRADFEAMASEVFEGNAIRMPFLMTRATKTTLVS